MYEQLRIVMERHLRGAAFAQADIAALLIAEKRLGFDLPPSYVWWATHYGRADIEGAPILGIANAHATPGAQAARLNDIVGVELSRRAAGLAHPQRLELARLDGGVYMFDRHMRDSFGEWSVVFVDEAGHETVCARHFGEFLLKALQESPAPSTVCAAARRAGISKKPVRETRAPLRALLMQTP